MNTLYVTSTTNNSYNDLSSRSYIGDNSNRNNGGNISDNYNNINTVFVDPNSTSTALTIPTNITSTVIITTITASTTTITIPTAIASTRCSTKSSPKFSQLLQEYNQTTVREKDKVVLAKITQMVETTTKSAADILNEVYDCLLQHPTDEIIGKLMQAREIDKVHRVNNKQRKNLSEGTATILTAAEQLQLIEEAEKQDASKAAGPSGANQSRSSRDKRQYSDEEEEEYIVKEAKKRRGRPKSKGKSKRTPGLATQNSVSDSDTSSIEYLTKPSTENSPFRRRNQTKKVN